MTAAVPSVGKRQEALEWVVSRAPAALALFDRGMRYLAVSPRYASAYRTAARDLIGRSHYDVFPDLPDRWRAIHARCLAGAHERCDDDAFTRSDGTTDRVSWDLAPWHADDGTIGGLMLLSEVVTAQQQAEAALVYKSLELERRTDELARKTAELERKNSELEALLETVPAAIFITHDGGAHIAANRYGRDLLNARPGQNVSDSAPAGERPGYRVLRGGVHLSADDLPVQVAATQRLEVHDWDCTIQADDGTAIELLGFASPLADDPAGAVACFVDITARRRAEQAVRTRDAWLRTMFDHSEQIMFVKQAIRDASGEIVDFRLLEVSHAAARARGMTRDEILAMTLTKLVRPEDAANRLAGFRGVLETGATWNYEVTYNNAVHMVSAFRLDAETIYTTSVDVSRLLGSIIPMCAWCRKVDVGERRFVNFEQYVESRLGATVSHGICPACAARATQEFDENP